MREDAIEAPHPGGLSRYPGAGPCEEGNAGRCRMKVDFPPCWPGDDDIRDRRLARVVRDEGFIPGGFHHQVAAALDVQLGCLA